MNENRAIGRDRLLTPAEVARELAVTPQTVRRYIAQGRLSCSRLPSGRIRIPRAEVERMLSQQPAGVLPLPGLGRRHDSGV